MGLTWQVRITGGRGEALTARASQAPLIGVMPAGSLLPYIWPAVLDDQRQPFTNLVQHDLGEVMFGPMMSRWAQREYASNKELRGCMLATNVCAHPPAYRPWSLLTPGIGRD